MLVGLLGDDEVAPIYVQRLWAHCQSRKQTQFENLPNAAIRAICRFTGDADLLVDSMIECGFIERISGNNIEVTGWEEHNSQLVAAWENGRKGGRPKKPRNNPRVSSEEPTDNPPETHGQSDKEDKEDKSKKKEERSGSSDPARFDQIKRVCQWWNTLKTEGLVLAGVDEINPSKEIRSAWNRVQRDSRLRDAFKDLGRLRDAVRGSPFVQNAGWFTLVKLMGAKNRSGEVIVLRLLEDGYADTEQPQEPEIQKPRVATPEELANWRP